MAINIKPVGSTTISIKPAKKKEPKFETYSERKKRLFKLNADKIYTTIKNHPQTMTEVELKKRKDELCIYVYRGGTKIATIINDEVIFHITGEIIDILKSAIAGKDEKNA